ncbi:uncharacterized protein LOC109834783 [Asparagus officinalis]|uniref:uncharacterized protein LOC109834783 n=1 Tax=Asparagus officinalis TaxID=4686 RepID=UPI00098E63C0|nr:uncharacterized protein LOC109834783 [Asparagus officinalis]
MCSSFLWGHKIHLVSWSSVCQDIKHGGLGLFSAKFWNYATAAKLLWMIHLKKDILWIKWVHGTYLRQTSIWQIQSKNCDSWMWKQLLKARNMIRDKMGSVDNLLNAINSCCVNNNINISSIYRVLFSSSLLCMKDQGLYNFSHYMELSSTASNPLMSSQNRESEWPKKNKIKCTLCGHETTGGISRQKEHLAGSRGNTKPCKKVTPDIIARVKAAMAETKGKKSDKIRFEIERRQDVDISNSRIENAEEITKIGNKRPREFGAIHRYATFLPEEPTSSLTMKQTTVDAAERKRRKELVHEWVSLWTYESGIPFHALMLPSFNNMCEAIGQFGPGYVGPTMYQLREPLLKKAVSRTSVGLEPHKKLWETTGCTLMTDSWTDRKHRCVMNMCIHSSAGVIFYNSIEKSAESHTGDFIYKWVDQCIQEIGADYVVQVVTDNHSANMAAKEKLKIKRPRIFWTSCAAHTTNLMLQDIGKLTNFKNIIEKARALTVFIYGHTRTLALMRKCTRRKDIVRPGTTRFATSFLTLGSLLEKKDALMAMFNSDEFTSLKFVGAAKKKALTANATVISRTFWRGVRSCLKVFTPLFKFLRMVDSDTCPSMGFIIGELNQVKREIMTALKTEKSYMPIISIIERHAKNRLDSSLHLAAWFLNPLFYYAEDEK